MSCNLCPRKCGVDRENNIGYCGQSNELSLARVGLHHWEEPIISGDKGSGTIFFSGCNMQCVFCQNYEISRGKGKNITTQRLADIFKKLEDMGAHNINLVTGTHYVGQIINAMEIYKPNIPIVYNCSGYESLSTIQMLNGLVDIYLPDLKYSDNILAKKYSNCKDYFDIAGQAILQMKKQQPVDIVDNGIMKKGLIIRHLVMPNAIDNSLDVINWLEKNLPKTSYISLMGQYLPCGNALEYPELSRKIKPLEYKIVLNKLLQLGFDNAFIQDLTSAEKEFIPDFNFEGV